jgi:Tfp pilus assembly protein PilX
MNRPGSYRSRGEKGIALVMALLVLLIVSIVGALLMASLQVETKVAGHGVREASALNVAEAGLAEAMARIKHQDVPDTPGNPRMVTQIFNVAAGSVPTLGADSTGLATGQQPGQWLPYSTATRSGDALTVEYKTNATRTAIYRYDETKDPPVNTATGLPIYRITATGIRGGDRKRIIAEIIQKPVNISIKAALAGNKGIDFVGNAVACGYNHSADTPWPAGVDGHNSGPKPCNAYVIGGGDLNSSWSTGPITGNGAANTFSPYSPKDMQNMTGFYQGPWEAVGLPQSEFWSWVGAPYATEPASPVGIIYLDNNGTHQDKSGSFAYHGATGEGLLYVDGDLTLNAGFVYTGLIYVEGDLLQNGQAWVLGALIVNGHTNIKVNGGATIIYSSDAIKRVLAKYGGEFVTLSWHEQ